MNAQRVCGLSVGAIADAYFSASFRTAFDAALAIIMVIITAMIVTMIAYVTIGPAASGLSGKSYLKIASIAPFHASVATNPNAGVIKAAILSITSFLKAI
jgi:hypothetical protein